MWFGDDHDPKPYEFIGSHAKIISHTQVAHPSTLWKGATLHHHDPLLPGVPQVIGPLRRLARLAHIDNLGAKKSYQITEQKGIFLGSRIVEQTNENPS